MFANRVVRYIILINYFNEYKRNRTRACARSTPAQIFSNVLRINANERWQGGTGRRAHLPASKAISHIGRHLDVRVAALSREVSLTRRSSRVEERIKVVAHMQPNGRVTAREWQSIQNRKRILSPRASRPDSLRGVSHPSRARLKFSYPLPPCSRNASMCGPFALCSPGGCCRAKSNVRYGLYFLNFASTSSGRPIPKLPSAGSDPPFVAGNIAADSSVDSLLCACLYVLACVYICCTR